MNPIERKKKEKFIREYLGERLRVTFDPLMSYREGNIALLTFRVKYGGDFGGTMPLEIECDENLNIKDIEEKIMCENLSTAVLFCVLTNVYKVKVLNLPRAEIQPHLLDYEYCTEFVHKEGLIDIFADNYLEDLVDDINKAKKNLYFYDLPDTTSFENAYQLVAKTLNEYDDQPVENIDCLRSDYLKRKLKTEIGNEKNTPELRKQLDIVLHEPNFSDKYNELAVRI